MIRAIGPSKNRRYIIRNSRRYSFLQIIYTTYRRSEITKYNRTSMGLSDRSIGLGWLAHRLQVPVQQRGMPATGQRKNSGVPSSRRRNPRTIASIPHVHHVVAIAIMESCAACVRMSGGRIRSARDLSGHAHFRKSISC